MLLDPQVILIDFAGTAIDPFETGPVWQSSRLQIPTLHCLAYERISEQREAARPLRIQLAKIRI
jgi:hypothetical protein